LNRSPMSNGRGDGQAPMASDRAADRRVSSRRYMRIATRRAARIDRASSRERHHARDARGYPYRKQRHRPDDPALKKTSDKIWSRPAKGGAKGAAANRGQPPMDPAAVACARKVRAKTADPQAGIWNLPILSCGLPGSPCPVRREKFLGAGPPPWRSALFSGLPTGPSPGETRKGPDWMRGVKTGPGTIDARRW